MRIYVFERIEQVSWNYHAGGGLVVIAKDENHVKQLILKEEHIEITDEEWKDVESFALSENVEPKIYVMPDAGCC